MCHISHLQRPIVDLFSLLVLFRTSYSCFHRQLLQFQIFFTKLSGLCQVSVKVNTVHGYSLYSHALISHFVPSCSCVLASKSFTIDSPQVFCQVGLLEESMSLQMCGQVLCLCLAQSISLQIRTIISDFLGSSALKLLIHFSHSYFTLSLEHS